MTRRYLAILLMLALLLPSFAAAAPQATDPYLQQSSSTIPGVNNSNAQLNSAVNSLSSYYSNYFKNSLANTGATWLNNTSFSLFAGSDWTTLNYQVNTVQPLFCPDWLQAKSLGFIEANVQGNGNNVTGNVGLGYRKLTENKNILMGVNAFYDIGSTTNNSFSYGYGYQSAGGSLVHQRVGVGLEYMQSYFEGHANFYLPISARQYLGYGNNMTAFYQEALSGYDVSVASAIPGAQWLKANVRGYQYFGNNTSQIVGSNSFMKGFDFSANAQITPQFALSGGYDTGAQNGYIKANLNLLALPVPALFLGDDTINNYANLNLSNKMLNQVDRNNAILVANESQNAYNGAYVTFTSRVLDWSGNPVVNMPVSIVNAAGTYTYSSMTNSSGDASFTIPQSMSPTGAVGSTPQPRQVWNIIVQPQQATLTGSVYNWSKTTLIQAIVLDPNDGRLYVNDVVLPVDAQVVTFVTQPQPTKAQADAHTDPGTIAPIVGGDTICTVNVKDATGAAVAGFDLTKAKVILLSPSYASSNMSNLRVASLTQAGASSFTFKPLVNYETPVPGSPTNVYQMSGTYGVTYTDPATGVVYGNTVDLKAYDNGLSHSVDIVVKAMATRNVTVTVRDYLGKPVADGTCVRVGSSVAVVDPYNYNPPAVATVNGVANFTGIPADGKFYVLAYTTNYSQTDPQRTIIATGQWDNITSMFPTGNITLSVQQLPPVQ